MTALRLALLLLTGLVVTLVPMEARAQPAADAASSSDENAASVDAAAEGLSPGRRTFVELLQGFHRGNSLEIAVGDISVTGRDHEGVHFATLSIAYLIEVKRWFSFGPWLGSPLFAVRNGRADFPAFWSTPLMGVKAVLGNKAESFAVALNVGLFPSVGFYFRSFFLNVLVVPYNEPTRLFGGFRNRLASIELGYSFRFAR